MDNIRKMDIPNPIVRLCCMMLLLLFLPTIYAQNTKKIMGTVLDEVGDAMIGAAVIELGTSNATITDFDGNFSLQISSRTKEIKVSYVGYETKYVKIPSTGDITIYMGDVMHYKKAAKKGNAFAQYELGLCYYSGDGVSQNYNEAVKWYREAAGQGHKDAQYSLGGCYLSGHGVSQS